MSDKAYKNIFILIIMIGLWLGGTSFSYWVINPELTEMQVFLHIGKSFILDMGV